MRRGEGRTSIFAKRAIGPIGPLWLTISGADFGPVSQRWNIGYSPARTFLFSLLRFRSTKRRGA